jgi:uncharacterized membrane protein YccC
MNRSLPPPPPGPSFRTRHLFNLQPAWARMPHALGNALCVGAPVAAGWAAGDIAAGLLASWGAFTALYGADRPYRNRGVVLAATAVALAAAVALGVLAQPFGHFAIAAVVLIAMAATLLCNALRVGPPGAYMFALACAIGTGLPIQHLTWWQAGVLVLAGGVFSWLVKMAGAITAPRAPEKKVVTAAASAVARFLEAVGTARQDACRHEAAVSLYDTWSTLVARQSSRSSGDGELSTLRAISRDLHRLFVEGLNAPRADAGLHAAAARARALGAEALQAERETVRAEAPAVPLGHHDAGEALRESLRWPSPVLVVTLRVGLAAAISALAGAVLEIERAYWIVATAVMVLHQGLDWTRTLQRGFDRVLGTLVGLGLAGAILVAHPRGLWLAATLATLQFMIQMFVVRNYALAVVFITAAAITMISGAHDTVNIPLLLWDRGIDTVIGCAIGLLVLRITAPRSVAAPIPQELSSALQAAQTALAFAASGNVVSASAKEARRDLQHRTIALLTAYESSVGATPRHRDYAERLWPTVVAAQRLLYRVLALCWEIEDAGPDRAAEVARRIFGENGLPAAVQALTDIGAAIMGDNDVKPVAWPHVPQALKADIEELAGTLGNAAVLRPQPASA